MLEGLDAIAWGDLEHAGGAAVDVPDMLRAMASPDPAVAFAAAGESIVLCRESTVFSATAAAMPFVMELARSPQVHVRGALLGLCAVAAVSEGEYEVRPYGVRRALASTVDALMDVVRDPDAEIRMLAATCIGNCDPPPATAASAVMQLERDEPEPAVRAALIASAVACDPRRDRGWVEEAFRDPSPAVRAAAVFATASNGLPWSREALETLHDSLTDGNPFTSLPWVWTLDGLTSTILCLGPDLGWEVLDHLLHSPLPTVRLTAVRTVQRVLWDDPGSDPRARTALAALLADEAKEVRREVKQLIKLLGGKPR